MTCKYSYLLPIWTALIIHQIIFSPQFESLRQRINTSISSVQKYMDYPYEKS